MGAANFESQLADSDRVLEPPPPYPPYHALLLFYLPQEGSQGKFQLCGLVVLGPLCQIFCFTLEPIPAFSFGHWPPQTSFFGTHLDLRGFIAPWAM